MHQGVEHEMRKGARKRARERGQPGERLVQHPQLFQHEGADRLADRAGHTPDQQRTCQGMGIAVEHSAALDHAHQRLDIHQYLRAAEYHERKTVAASGFEQRARSQVKGSKRHQRTPTQGTQCGAAQVATIAKTVQRMAQALNLSGLFSTLKRVVLMLRRCALGAFD